MMPLRLKIQRIKSLLQKEEVVIDSHLSDLNEQRKTIGLLDIAINQSSDLSPEKKNSSLQKSYYLTKEKHFSSSPKILNVSHSEKTDCFEYMSHKNPERQIKFLKTSKSNCDFDEHYGETLNARDLQGYKKVEEFKSRSFALREERKIEQQLSELVFNKERSKRDSNLETAKAVSKKLNGGSVDHAKLSNGSALFEKNKIVNDFYMKTGTSKASTREEDRSTIVYSKEHFYTPKASNFSKKNNNISDQHIEEKSSFGFYSSLKKEKDLLDAVIKLKQRKEQKEEERGGLYQKSSSKISHTQTFKHYREQPSNFENGQQNKNLASPKNFLTKGHKTLALLLKEKGGVKI